MKVKFSVAVWIAVFSFIMLSCDGGERQMVMVTGAERVKFVLNGFGTVTVDWGDGSEIRTTQLRAYEDNGFQHEYSGTIPRRITITGKDVTSLYCHGNELTELDVSRNPGLVTLVCNDNRLRSLDVSRNKNLVNLYCGRNQLTELNVGRRGKSKSYYIDCSHNQLAELDVSRIAGLVKLNCSHNLLTAIKGIRSENLDSLDFAYNQFTELDMSDIRMFYLSVAGNKFTASALNAMFETLHNFDYGKVIYDRDGNSKVYGKAVNIGDNPGSADCDPGIAHAKKWTVEGFTGTEARIIAADIPEIVEEPMEDSTAAQIVTVSTPEEFVEAIGSNKIIQIGVSELDITQIASEGRVGKNFRSQWELTVFKVNNMKIVGMGDIPVRIVTANASANVMVFEDCKNITIENINAGHIPERTNECSGGVFYITRSENFTINNSILFGSGIYGITANNVTGLKCNHSVIKECTWGIMNLQNSHDVEFNNCEFFDNDGDGGLIYVYESGNIVFRHSRFYNNRAAGGFTFFFYGRSAHITVNGGAFENNRVHILSDDNPENVVELILNDVELNNNDPEIKNDAEDDDV